MIKIERNSKSVVDGVSFVLNNYENLISEIVEDRDKFDWSVIVDRLIKIYESVKIINKTYSSEESKSLYIKTFDETQISYREPRNNVNFQVHFVKSPTIQINGNTPTKYNVEFWSDQKLIYGTTLGMNMW